MPPFPFSLGLAAALALAAGACARTDPPAAPSAAPEGESITAASLLGHIEVLASDRFEGRALATPGEDSTIAYLTDQFRRMGLVPGNPDGTYVQSVPMIGFTPKPDASFHAGGRTIALRFPEDYVAYSRRVQPRIDVHGSDLVFVGYGVQAPEYDWDDFKDVDVRGKTVVILINDPPVPDPADPSRLDSTVFKGDAMTYYGRWTYKYEEASRKGAAAAVIVHETGPAGYPYSVISSSNSREGFDVEPADGNRSVVPVQAWITVERARELFRAAGKDFDQLKSAAARRDFRPVELGATADFHIDNEMRKVRSRNVVAKLEGSDPARKDEYVIYSAHWDHLGRDPSLPGDQIYNGALDNASGTSALLEIARAFAALPTPPARSILFLATTSEEQGLLGAKYYANNPLYPLTRTAADINIDGVNQWGPTHDLTVVGWNMSTLQDVLGREAAARNRVLTPDPEPEKGFYYRADHFEFAKQGVPALYTDAGEDFIGKPEGYGKQKRDEYTANDYHQPSDEIKPDWDLSGAAEDVRLLFRVGWDVAQAPAFPEWKPGTEFRARREEML
ncbi:MAG TPA: M28 family metallopeptidase, partial [Longimicrobiaceae bacterium]|nr:M28 family metallopeptidase [Longimicrobiaceae bacterium]